MDNIQLSYKSVTGKEILDWIIPLAELRINVFKDWPYLYVGSVENEKRYLSRYVNAQKSFVIMALNGHKVIGASTCIWLPEESDAEIQKAFTDHNFKLEEVVYFGESVLLSEYRGFGIGSEFMKAREEFAVSCSAKYAAFCSVIRPDDHPLKPSSSRSLEDFWKRRNFVKQEHMFCEMSWNDIDQNSESTKRLQFWVKKIN